MNEYLLGNTRYGRIVLTFASNAQKYAAPALRLEDQDGPDLGPRELLPTGITAAEYVCRVAHTLSPEGQAAAKAFCGRWPEGPQPTAERAAIQKEAMWEEA